MFSQKCVEYMYFKLINFIICTAILSTFLCFTECKVFNENGVPVIIWWTDLLFPHLGKESEIFCPSGNCIASIKRVYVNDNVPIIYLFYGTDFDPEILPLPREKNHFWALLHEESPMNNYMLSHKPGITLFNFTSTFSQYSDFPLTTQFLPSVEYFTDRKPISIEDKNKLRKAGLAPILYLQSHCSVASDRDSYVSELMKFIEVDSYGACLHNKDLPSHLISTESYNDESLFTFISNYKFHLAFENALCDDYITEKLYRAFYVGSVPIYKGSSTVKDWVPSHNSVIVVDDFSTPQELAQFISFLDRNDSLYNSYLEFKETGITNDILKNEILNRTWGVNDINKIDFIQGFECFICDRIHTQNFTLPLMANKSHMNCQQPHPTFYDKINKE